jgi:FkbM family methyltransferase
MSPARERKSIAFFVKVYRWARFEDLLEFHWFRAIFVAAYFLYKRFCEDPLGSLIQRNPKMFREGDILDIGANVGYTASLFARTVGPDARIYAFEPDCAAYQMLSDVVRRKNLPPIVEAIHSAVGDEVGSVEFWHNKSHSADHRVATAALKATGLLKEDTESVPLTSVDAFVASRQLQRVAFIKVDVQGYEIAVCRGSEKTLQRFPDAIFCVEYSPESMRDLGFDPQELLQFFRSRGYQLYLLTPATLSLAPDNAEINAFAASAGYVDLICSRKTLSGAAEPTVSTLLQ